MIAEPKKTICNSGVTMQTIIMQNIHPVLPKRANKCFFQSVGKIDVWDDFSEQGEQFELSFFCVELNILPVTGYIL